jgi:cellulose synthase/poly-beta-1,6-N-acetylglucosamine synthase-like glycosyltransferase
MSINTVILGLLLYTYIGYPIVIFVLGKMLRNPIISGKLEPKVTVVIAAYNEEKYIYKKIQNALALDYATDKLEVILVSDGSTDATLNIAKSIQSNNLIIIEQPRSGKATALNYALTRASGTLVLFTDANVFLNQDCLKHIVQIFADSTIGAVTGKVNLLAIDSAEPLGEGMYMRYERFIQKYESLFSSVVGADGGMFMARKELIKKLPEDIILDDFYIVMNIILQEKRIVYEENASAHELVPASVTQEFKRKSRIAAGGFQVLQRLPKLLVYTSNIKFLFEFYSHKVLRWVAPIFLILLYLTSLPANSNKCLLVVFITQNIVYALALLGKLSTRLRRVNIIYLCYYFTALNIAVFIGMLKAITKRQTVKWSRVER